MAKTKKTPRGGARKKARTTARKSTRAKARTRAASRRAGKRSARKGAARKAAKTRKPAARASARKAGTRKAAKKTARKTAARKPAARKTAARKTAARKAPARTPAARAPKPAAAPASRQAAAKPARRPPTLDRERRRVVQDEPAGVPSSLDLDRSASAVRTGREEFRERLGRHTSTGPAMTGGDVDADWESAATVGDEAPGGDNPTPDQDVVDEIGKALGVEYDDDEELRGGDEIAERDRHRWDDAEPGDDEERED